MALFYATSKNGPLARALGKTPAAAGRKPNSVRLRSPCGELRRDDHSSSPVIADGIERPTRRLRTGRPSASPYLALLRAGFCLPPVLPRARCALTAPFHPYLSTHPFGVRSRQARESWACLERAPEGRVEGRYIFCATLRQVALPGRYPAHCPMEFGLSSPGGTTHARMNARVVPVDSDRLAWLRLLRSYPSVS